MIRWDTAVVTVKDKNLGSFPKKIILYKIFDYEEQY